MKKKIDIAGEYFKKFTTISFVYINLNTNSLGMVQTLPTLKRYFAACFMMLGLLFAGTVSAQNMTILQQDQSVTPYHMDAAPNMARQATPVNSNHNNGTAGAAALWDIQFDTNATATSNGTVSQAGALFFNNEYWCSQWNSDTILRYGPNGVLTSKFAIAGLTGTRSITTDGTSLYAGTASNTIYQINPATQALTGTIASQAAVTARFVTYDPTLNGNMGGFWIGNFNTDIVAISMAGAVLSTIPVATHTLSGMYGAAYDGFSSGGPYLWVFNQGGPNASSIDQLQLPAGTPTGVTRDVFLDFNTKYSLQTGLAGGLFVAQGVVSGQNTIGGMLQGNPSNILFNYELSDPTPAGPDASIGGVGADPAANGGGYTQIPVDQAGSLTFGATVTNVSQGAVTLGTVNVDFTVRDASNAVVFTDQQTVSNLAPLASAAVTSAPFTGAVLDDYSVEALVSLGGGQTDTFPTNDSAASVVSVTDTTYARDNGNVTGSSLSIGAGSAGFIGQEFDIVVNDTLSSAIFWLENPVLGDSVKAVVIPMGPLSPAGAPIGTSETLFITDTTAQLYELSFPGGVALTAGTAYFLGLEESVDGRLTIGTTSEIFTPGKGWVFFNGNWNNSEDFNFNVAYILRGVFSEADSIIISIDDELNTEVVAYPNPSEDYLNVAVSSGNHSDLDIRVYDVQGRTLVEGAISANNHTTRLFVGDLAKGIYLLEVSSPEGRHIERIMIK